MAVLSVDGLSSLISGFFLDGEGLRPLSVPGLAVERSFQLRLG